MDLSNVTDWLFGRGAYAKPSPPDQTSSVGTPTTTTPTTPSVGTTYTAEPPWQYPTDEDVDFARKNDWSYGQPWAPEFNNKAVNLQIENPFATNPKRAQIGGNLSAIPSLKPANDVLAKAALASRGSALSELGFDPTKIGLDVVNNPEGGKHLERFVGGDMGMYDPTEDRIYANAFTPGAVVHEALHRGIDRFSETPEFKNEWMDQFMRPHWGQPSDEEYLVRHLMETKMGNPEREYDSWGDPKNNASKMQRDIARQMFDPTQSPYANKRNKMADDMEAAAAQYIAAKHPGGPR